MATSKKKKAPVATDVATDLAPPQYAERLERIESQLSMLVEALTSPIDPPSLVKKRADEPEVSRGAGAPGSNRSRCQAQRHDISRMD